MQDKALQFVVGNVTRTKSFTSSVLCWDCLSYCFLYFTCFVSALSWAICRFASCLVVYHNTAINCLVSIYFLRPNLLSMYFWECLQIPEEFVRIIIDGGGGRTPVLRFQHRCGQFCIFCRERQLNGMRPRLNYNNLYTVQQVSNTTMYITNMRQKHAADTSWWRSHDKDTVFGILNLGLST